MEDNKKKKNPQEEEKEESMMIPVLTVFKKNAIIKNIFIILDNNNNKNDDQILVVGRDTSCSIVLTHPSISRSHLIFRFTPSSRYLSIEDLSSVHGTWLCGKKLEPGLSVELKERDTIKIGLSSRVYLLRFVKGVDSLCFDETLYHLLAPPSVHDSVDDTDTIEDCSQEEIPRGETNLLCTLKEYVTQNICMPVMEAVQATKLNQLQGPATFTAQQQQQPSSVEDFWFTSPTPTTDPESFADKCAATEAVTPIESEFGDGAEVEDTLTTGARASVDSHSLSDGEKQDECCQEDDSKLHNLNAESCNDEKGYSMDELAEDIGNKWIENIGPESFDENEVAVTLMPKECDFECTVLDNDMIEDSLTTGARIFNSEENTYLPNVDAIPRTQLLQIKIVREVAVDSLSDGEEQNKCDWELNSYMTPKSCDKGYSLEKIIEDRFPIESSLNPSIPEEAYLKTEEERQTPQSVAGWFDVEILETCLEEEATGRISNSTFDSNIWPKSGMSASAHQDQTRKSKFINTSSVDTKDEMSNLKGTNIINRSMPKDLFSVLDEEEMFIPKDLFSVLDEEEMFTPKKQSMVYSMSQNLHTLKADFSPSIYLAERSTSATPNKENQTPKSAQEWKRKPHECQDIMELKKKPVERVPLQSLMNSAGNHKSWNSSTSSAAKTVDRATARASICGQISDKPTKPSHISEGKRSRQMVVDFGSSPFSAGGICKSGDSSPFSAGGICKSGDSSPFSVAKTLDGATAGASNCVQISIKHTKPSHISEEGKRSWDMVVVDTASLLDKDSRKALQLLQGLKGTRLIIPESVLRELGSMKQQFRFFRRTSEADLTLQWIKECMENTKWWIHIQSSMVIVDDVLDYALQYRRKENAGQIVLLSNDVTLKIKSMAKGLLCETVQQFRKSLVNPFSDRFMWAKSAPRGLTWSCHDDVVLWEKYSGLPSKAGLKLINSTLAMMMWF